MFSELCFVCFIFNLLCSGTPPSSDDPKLDRVYCAYAIFRDKRGYYHLEAKLWDAIVLCFYRCGGVWRFVRILARCLEKLVELTIDLPSFFEGKITTYFGSALGWMDTVKTTYLEAVSPISLDKRSAGPAQTSGTRLHGARG